VLRVVLVSEGESRLLDWLLRSQARKNWESAQDSYVRPDGGMRHGLTAVERRLLFLIGPWTTALCFAHDKLERIHSFRRHRLGCGIADFAEIRAHRSAGLGDFSQTFWTRHRTSRGSNRSPVFGSYFTYVHLNDHLTYS
jgi:hypothetical protein